MFYSVIFIMIMNQHFFQHEDFFQRKKSLHIEIRYDSHREKMEKIEKSQKVAAFNAVRPIPALIV